MCVCAEALSHCSWTVDEGLKLACRDAFHVCRDKKEASSVQWVIIRSWQVNESQGKPLAPREPRDLMQPS